MEWWSYAVSGVGAVVGVTGGVRGWRADRRSVALSDPWQLEHLQNSAWVLKSRMVSNALDVDLQTEAEMRITKVDGDLDVIHPGGFVKLIIFKPLTGGGTGLVVSWRQGLLRRRRTLRVLLPPAPSS